MFITSRLKTYLENMKITPLEWLAGISSVIFVRFLLEIFSSKTSSSFFGADFSTMVHYYIYFIALALALVVFTKKVLPDFGKITFQFVGLIYGLILIAPILDILISGVNKVRLVYLFDTPREMLYSLLTFFGPDFSSGATIGIRIEVLLVMVAIGLLVYFSSRNVVRSVFSAIGLYLLIFAFGSMPGIISFVVQFGGDQVPIVFWQKTIQYSATVSNNIAPYLQYSSINSVYDIAFNMIMGKIFLIIAVALIIVIAKITIPEKLKAFWKNSRPERIANYIFLIILGTLVAKSSFPSLYLNWADYLSIFILCLSLYFSCAFAIYTNDIVDLPIDKVSNKWRPLVGGELSVQDAKQSLGIFLLISVLAGYLSGFLPFFFMLSFTALYYMYSAEPTRYKLIPLFSSFLIGLCCISAFLSGFFIISPVKDITVLPFKYLYMIFVFYFLFWHIRDIKDIEGDKNAGVITVPVLFGDYWGPRVVAILSSLAFLIVPLFLSNYFILIPAVGAVLGNYYFVLKKPYSEKPLFINYLIFLVIVFVLMIFQNSI